MQVLRGVGITKLDNVLVTSSFRTALGVQDRNSSFLAHPSSPWRMLPALPNAPNSWDSLPFLPEKVESNLIPPGTPKGGELLLFIGIPARFQRLEKSHGDAWCAPYPLISSNYRA